MRLFLVNTIFILCAGLVSAQQNDRWSMSGIGVMHTFIGNPLDASSAERAPAYGGSLLLEFVRKQNQGYRFSHLYQAGYYHHPDVSQVFFVSWKANFALELAKVVRLHGLAGFGYAHSWPLQERYVFKEGKYEASKTAGSPHLMPRIGFGISLGGQHIARWEVYAHYEAYSLAPYALQGDIPFSLHGAWEFGVKRALR
ncbi:MAG: hypothetical protein KTR24_17655 [Saprospiraceae bacterium]|nr:hypothetical protein [Saprospiraceae bacterium]